MPFLRRQNFRRRSGPRPVISSIKNSVSDLTGIAVATKTVIEIAKAVAAGVYDNLNVTEVVFPSKISRIWCEFWVEGTADITLGTTYSFDGYIWKNPGNNLTEPVPGTQGSSNEKKFIFKTWKGLITNVRTNGGPFYNWKGWIKVPKVYQRMGTDDRFEFVVISTGGAALVCSQFIYKSYT